MDILSLSSDDGLGYRDAAMELNKRTFFTGVTALSLLTDMACAQAPKKAMAYGPQRRTTPHGMVKTTKLFQSPPGFANALAIAPEGLWIGQQKVSGPHAMQTITCLSLPICMKPPGWWTGTASCSRR